jgi:hypothetical protein
MKIRNTIAIFGFSLLVSGLAVADHHEKSGAVMPAAKSGQLIAYYHWPCADAETGLDLLKEMIAYESQHSPIPYSATPAIHEDGALVSIDVHGSAESLEKAAEWQNTDEQWQAWFAEMTEACGSADDLSMSILTVQ